MLTTVRKFWTGSLYNQAHVLCAASGSGGSRKAEDLAQEQRIWGGGQLCEDHLWRSVPPSIWIFSFSSSLQLCSRICSAFQVRWLVVLAKSSLPRRTWTVSSWVEPPLSQSLLTLWTPRHKNWPLATSETTFRAFSFSPSLSVLLFLFNVLVQWCHFPILLFFSSLAYLVILQRDKLTHSLYRTETRQPVCVLTATPSAQSFWPSVCAFTWKVYKKLCELCHSSCQSKVSCFVFKNTDVSLCNYDVQWLLTPCRCARPALVGCLAKRELSFRVDQLAWRTNGENAVRRRYNKCYRDYFSCIESNFCVHFWLAAILLIIPADHT